MMRPVIRRWRTTPEPVTDPGLVLLRSICHELRPPVATLTSLMRALEKNQPEPLRTELAQLAVAHAAHAEAVLRQAAAAAYGMDLPVDQAMELRQVLPAVAATVPADRLHVRIGRGADRRLVHPQHVRQVLINLLSNAERHGPPGGPIRLDVRTRGRGLRLTVSDPGTLTPELSRSLHRTDPPPGEKGLGLWVVRHLVTTHGGSVRARRLRPSGVAVEVTLPRHR
jgi:two-component system, OmpR family, sensor kinase